METESAPTADLPQQAPPPAGTRNKKYLYMLLGFMFLLFLAIGGSFIIKNTSQSKQNVPQVPTSKECRYNGKTYKLGESVPSVDGCNSCSCSEDGQVSCTAMACENSNSQSAITPSVMPSDASASSSVTPVQFTTYKDEEFGYQVAYDADLWMFRHTYGKGGISNSDTSGTPRIVSGFDLHRPSNINATAIIVLNVLEAYNETDIDEWIRKYELNIPKNASSQLNLNQNMRTREYTYRHDASDKFIRRTRYFIYKNKVFRFYYSEINDFSQETMQIIEMFKS